MRSLAIVLTVLACSSLVYGESKLHKIEREIVEKVKQKETEIVQGLEQGVKSLKNTVASEVAKVEKEFNALFQTAENKLENYALSDQCLANANYALKDAKNNSTVHKCSDVPEQFGRLLLEMGEHTVAVAVDASSIVTHVSSCVAMGPLGGIICMAKYVTTAYSTFLDLYKQAKSLVVESIQVGTKLTLDVKQCFNKEKPKTVALIQEILLNAKNCNA